MRFASEISKILYFFRRLRYNESKKFRRYVLLAPHMGWKGLETRQRLVSILADNIKKFMEGTPINVVSSL